MLFRHNVQRNPWKLASGGQRDDISQILRRAGVAALDGPGLEHHASQRQRDLTTPDANQDQMAGFAERAKREPRGLSHIDEIDRSEDLSAGRRLDAFFGIGGAAVDDMRGAQFERGLRLSASMSAEMIISCPSAFSMAMAERPSPPVPMSKIGAAGEGSRTFRIADRTVMPEQAKVAAQAGSSPAKGTR